MYSSNQSRRIASTPNVRFHTNNPFDALADAGSDESTRSPSSTGGSLSFTSGNGSRGAPITPSRGQAVGFGLQATKHLNNISPHQTREVSISGNITPSSLTSPSNSRTRVAQNYSYGSPQKLISSRLSQLQALENSNETQMMQRDDSIASKPSHHSRCSSGRASFSSNLRSPTTFQSWGGTYTASMVGVPEPLAVQELAFRQGQHDHGSSRDRIPANPFAHHFDLIWQESYKLGKVLGGASATPAVPASSSHLNYAWPVLINPYTQDLENPNGSVDLDWTRKICDIALNCMDALIRYVCRRPSEWRKIVCDIPTQVQQALVAFPDLSKRYEILQEAAREAIRGRLPQGY